MRMTTAALALAFWTAAAPAQVAPPAPAPAPAPQPVWTHAQSGIALPHVIGDMRRGEERDLSGGAGTDLMIQYGSDADPVTVYIYRSAYPNPALWFERTRHAMQANVGTATQGVAPRAFSLARGAPDGLREEIEIPAGGRWKSTAVAIAQSGEWMVKARVTSQTLGRAEIAARMDRLLAAVRLPAAAGSKPHPLVVPGPCGGTADYRGAPLGGDLGKEVAAAAATGIVVMAESRGAAGLAADPAAWCRIASQIPDQYASVYRPRSGEGWVALVGDSGMAVSARMLLQPAERTPAAASYASNARGTSVVALFDAVPSPDAAILPALPVAAGQANGLMSITTEPREGK